MDAIFPFTTSLSTTQSWDAITLGYLPLIIFFWFFWSSLWVLIGTFLIALREKCRVTQGMYLYCFPKYQVREMESCIISQFES